MVSVSEVDTQIAREAEESVVRSPRKEDETGDDDMELD